MMQVRKVMKHEEPLILEMESLQNWMQIYLLSVEVVQCRILKRHQMPPGLRTIQV